jgi:hypothetical protein
MMRLRRTGTALLAALLVLPLAAPAARAATKLEGEYQLMMDWRKWDRPFLWDFDSNSYDVFNNIQFRLFSQPMTGVESFMKFEAAYNPSDNNAPAPEFHWREGHLRFRREAGKRGVDAYVFSRQDRFYIDWHLVPWVYGRGDAQGVRVDTWGWNKTSATIIASDRSGEFNPANFPDVPHQPRDSIAAQRANRTADAWIFRLRRNFLREDAVRAGLTWTRFEGWTGQDSTSAPAPWSSVVGTDLRWRVRGADLSVEYGESQDRIPRADSVRAPIVTFFKRPLGFRLPDRAIVQAELRSLKFGTNRTGYLNVTPAWWSRGPKWQNSLGGFANDETGFKIENYYLLPDRAVTYTNNLLWYGPRAYGSTKYRELSNELYIEFINGFTGKTRYIRRDIYRKVAGTTNRETHLVWFNELQVESRLAWLRVQSKMSDIGTPNMKQIFVVEQSLKLSDKTKIYDRFAFGNDPSVLRTAVFTQLQYRPTGNMEMFLQYGPDYIGGGSMPVDEGNLNGSGDQRDMIKFILKGNF